MMLNKIKYVSDSTLVSFQHVKPNQKSQTLLHNPPTNLPLFNHKGFQNLSSTSSYTRMHKYGNHTRKYRVHSSVDPGASPSGPPSNILSWIVAVAIGIAIPFINYKWGPLLKSKVEEVLQLTEDVAEAVEKVAEDVEKVAEDIADDLPKGGELKKAVDFVENLAERTAKDAGAVDDFIDEVQEEEEKAESIAESLKEAKRPTEEPNEEKPKEEKPNDQINLDK